MALKNTVVQSTMSLRYKDGIDATGKDVIKSKKFSNVKVTADDQSIFDTAEAFAPLMAYEITEISRSNESFLVNA